MVLPALIGLTGSIACGKSTVTKVLRAEGEAIIDFDEVAHEVMEPGQPGWRNVVAEFGEDVLVPASDPQAGLLRPVDRPKLGRLVFGDESARARLNGCMRTPIRTAGLKHLLVLWLVRGHARIFLDAPLLFENGLSALCAATMVVDVEEQTQIARLCARDDCDEAYARQKIAAQMPLAEKVKRATHVVDNNGTVEETARKVKQLLPQLPPSTLRRAGVQLLRVGVPLLLLVLGGRYALL